MLYYCDMCQWFIMFEHKESPLKNCLNVIIFQLAYVLSNGNKPIEEKHI